MKICPRCSELYPDDAARCPRDSTELKPVMDPLIGKTIGGRYRLISRLGSGGMSSVYLARHVMIDRLMAIKTLRRDLAQDPVQRDRFIREARAVNRINHENIVEITDFGESDEGLVYLVMEYVPGEPLLKSFARGPFESMRALNIAEQVGGALARAHQMGVVHRDLKPENILLVPRKGRPDFVKILDFGIAKILDAPSLTGSQQIFGTPGYIAPEYIQSTNIDGRADLYSTGVILYEMVTGALPFDYEYPGDLLVKHVTERPIPPSHRLPTIEPAIEELILRCLQKNPADRFRDAFHFLAELQKVRERIGPAGSWGAMNEVPDTGEGAEPIGMDEARAEPSLMPPPQTPKNPLAETLDGHEPGGFVPHHTLSGPAAAAEIAGQLDRPTVPEDFRQQPTHGAAREPRDTQPDLRARPPTQEYVRPSIPEPPTAHGMSIPIEIEIPLGQPPRAKSEPPRTRPLDPALDGVLGSKRWRSRFEALRATLDDIEQNRAAPPEVFHAMAFAARTLEELEDGVHKASDHEALIEALEAKARDFRASLGRAIDGLARKLSERRGEFEKLVARRNDLRSQREHARLRVRSGAPVAEGQADAILWELAAVEEELRGEGARCDDLEVQLAQLRTQLDKQNEQVETELAKLNQALDSEMMRLEPIAGALRDPLDLAERFIRAHHEASRTDAPSQPGTTPAPR